jgi:hypothetical protein
MAQEESLMNLKEQGNEARKKKEDTGIIDAHLKAMDLILKIEFVAG